MGMKTILSINLFLLCFSALAPEAPAAETWAVWADYEKPGNPIFYSRYNGENWETKSFPGSGEFAANYMPALGVDGEGRLRLVWAAQKPGSKARIYSSRNEGGRWSRPEPVNRNPGGWESNAAVTFDGEGKAWVVWAGAVGESSEIFSARHENGGFSSPVMVSRPDDSPDDKPAVTTDRSGNPVVVWQGWDGSRMRIFQSTYRNGGWSPAEAIENPAGGDAIRPSVVLDSEGEIEYYWESGGVVRSFLPAAGAEAARKSSYPLPSFPIPPSTLAASGGRILYRSPPGRWESLRYQETTPPLPPRGGKAAEGASSASHQYTCYGDSITFGETVEDPVKWYGFLLEESLEGAYPGNYFTLHNEGYPRIRTDQLLFGGGSWPSPGIDAILEKHNSSIIMIMGGTNDIVFGEYYGDTAWNLGEMIDRARSHNYEPILATIIPRWDTPVMLDRSRILSTDYIRPLADSKGCRLADPWQVFIDYGNYQSLYQSDHVHPTWPGGFRKVADAFFPAVPAPEPVEEGGPLDRIIDWARDWATGL